MFSAARLIYFLSVLALFGGMALYTYAMHNKVAQLEAKAANARIECRAESIRSNAIGQLKQLEGAYDEGNSSTPYDDFD